MTVYEKMKSGTLYFATDESLLSVQAQCLELQYEYNLTRPTEMVRRRELLQQMFAEVGEGTYIEPPLHANWAGHHVHLGHDVYFNFNVTLVDDTDIYIGDNTMIGPNCVIATAGHPVCPEIRAQGGQFNIPVHIGKNCWLGAGVIVLPGITATIRSSVQEASSQRICRPMLLLPATRAAFCAKSVNATGNIITKTEKSRIVI